MNMVGLFLALLAICGGAVLPVQFAVNSHLGRLLGSPFAASVVSFAAGTAGLLALSSLFVRTLPSVAALKAMPLYVFWVGGVCGSLFVVAAIVVTPRLGTAAMAIFAILGQVTAATLIDHFGLLGVTVREVSAGRFVGVVLVVAGAVMVRAF